MIPLGMLSHDVLPDSRLRNAGTAKHVVNRLGVYWEPIYCASCGKQGGLVPTENITSATWICDPCYETHGDILGAAVVPDDVFYARVYEEQLAKYGRALTLEETAVSLSDPDSLESKLARDRKVLTPRAAG